MCVGDVWLEAATSFPTFGLVNIIHISQIKINWSHPFGEGLLEICVNIQGDSGQVGKL